MPILRLAAVIILLITLGACSDRRLRSELEQIAASQSRVVLYSLDPSLERADASAARERFHDFAVLGSVEIREAAERQRILGELSRHAGQASDAMPMCFNPRHGLRVEQTGRIVDLVICFECGWIEPKGVNRDKGFFISHAPEDVFDQALTRYALPKSAE